MSHPINFSTFKYLQRCDLGTSTLKLQNVNRNKEMTCTPSGVHELQVRNLFCVSVEFMNFQSKYENGKHVKESTDSEATQQ